eukprot:GHVP01053768.1.p1 GENE.GHVP01053768.1~~GHVP01053768.1.p1  ORF type:complete len:515 (-),score=93.47 GHVP01053768.1:70-1593(-)
MHSFFLLLVLHFERAFSLRTQIADVDKKPYFSNLENYDERRKLFLETFGKDRYIEEVEAIAAKELTRFEGQTYLDYTGSSVYTTTQLENVFQDLKTNAFGNAHSRNPSAELTDTEMEHARNLIADFFDFTSDEYSVVFTSGATGSLKLVGEDFPWTSNSLYYYLRDNHNSVLGIREYVVSKGGAFKSFSEAEIKKILASRKEEHKINDEFAEVSCLFAYPLKDNFGGQYFSIEWIQEIHRYGLSDNCRWYVLVDSAAYAATDRIKAVQFGADFYVLSFYKLFGFPTGLGLLLMRSDIANEMKKLYWGGGTVVAADCDSRWCKLKENPSMRFEDGTASFLSIVSLKHGFEALERVGYNKVSSHVASLSEYVGDVLHSMKHSNGNPVAEIYTRSFPEYSEKPVGGVVAFNLLRPEGSYVNFGEVESLASVENIHLRTGCFCNPGACATFLGLTQEEMRQLGDTRSSCADPNNPLQQAKAIGAVRASFGYLSTFKDADTLLSFFKDNFVY